MHFILSPYEEIYHHVREPMRDPCSFQHDKCQFGNMHIRFGEFSSFNDQWGSLLTPRYLHAIVICTLMLLVPIHVHVPGPRLDLELD
jgi:hypothetical protein